MNAGATLLALASATFYGLSSALQQRAAKQEQPRRALDPRLLLRLLRRPMWMLGWLPDGAATALQAIALRLSPLAFVQPILVSGLFLAILLEAALNRSRPQPRELLAVTIGVVGLAAFLATAQPRTGVSDPTIPAWIGVGLGSGGFVAACLALAARSNNPARGALLGAATGLLYALTAALIKPLANKITADPLSILTDWHLYALILVGFVGLTLNQNAFQNGQLAAPLTTLTLIDPVASVTIGVTAFRETLSIGGPRLVIEIAAAAAMAVGIWLASTCRRRGATG
ncbi:DMT family transporter [Micromonospora sp. NPDC003776]